MVAMSSTSPKSTTSWIAPAARGWQRARRSWSSISAGCWPMPMRAARWLTQASVWSNSSAAPWSARSPRSSRICCRFSWRREPSMREPAFWHRPPSFASHLLFPLSAVYGAVAAHRLERQGLDAGIPVICVGNYHVGGAGKTPTVLALVALLRELGERPVVLSRGYGGGGAGAGGGA